MQRFLTHPVWRIFVTSVSGRNVEERADRSETFTARTRLKRGYEENIASKPDKYFSQ